jgi:glutamate transport system permease protein
MSRFTDALINVKPSAAGELQVIEPLGPRGRRRALLATAVSVLLIALVVAWAIGRFKAKGQFAGELWAPFRQWLVWKFLLLGLLNTLKAAGLALALSLAIGTTMAVLRSGPSRLSRVVSGVYVEGFRACALVLLITFFFYQLSHWFKGWSLGTYGFVAVVAGLTLYYSTVFAEVVRSGMRSMAKGQTEAGLSIGLTAWQTLRIVVLPQAWKRALPNIVTQAASLVKDTSLGYFVTYAELGYRADQLGASFGNKLQSFVVAGAIYVGVIALISAVANRLQNS